MQPVFRQVGRHQVGRLEEGGVPFPLEWLVIFNASRRASRGGASAIFKGTLEVVMEY